MDAAPLGRTKHHVEAMKLLTKVLGADPNTENNNGLTLLCWATKNVYSEMVKLLLAVCGANVNTRDDQGWTPLHHAVKRGHGKVVRLLVIEFKANVKAKAKDGITSLYLGIMERSSRDREAKSGADVNAKDNQGSPRRETWARRSRQVIRN